MSDFVYRVAFRQKGKDEWLPFSTFNSATGRPYVKESVAKGIATQKANYLPSYEFKVQRAPLAWEDIDG